MVNVKQLFTEVFDDKYFADIARRKREMGLNRDDPNEIPKSWEAQPNTLYVMAHRPTDKASNNGGYGGMDVGYGHLFTKPYMDLTTATQAAVERHKNELATYKANRNHVYDPAPVVHVVTINDMGVGEPQLFVAGDKSDWNPGAHPWMYERKHFEIGTETHD